VSRVRCLETYLRGFSPSNVRKHSQTETAFYTGGGVMNFHNFCAKPLWVLAAGRTSDGSAVLLSVRPFGRTSWLRIRSGDDATACLSIRLRLLGNRACRLSSTGCMVQYDGMRSKRGIRKSRVVVAYNRTIFQQLRVLFNTLFALT
jgi:hypothetical protein